MEPTHLFHALTRGALCVKRWLRGRKEIDHEIHTAFDRDVVSLCWADDARAWRDALAEIAALPAARVTDLVYERIGARLGMTANEARALVFGPEQRRRRSSA